jgi:hypothetical protein
MVCYYIYTTLSLSLFLNLSIFSHICIYVSSFFLFCDVYSICLALCVKNRRRTRAVMEDHIRTEYSYFFLEYIGGSVFECAMCGVQNKIYTNNNNIVWRDNNTG